MASLSYQLVMRSGPTPGKIFELSKGEIYIGRDLSNEVVINDAEISRKHCRMLLQGSTYLIEDLGSTNGTFVNGQRLMGPHMLQDGEMLMLGENVGLVYEAAQYDPNATMISGAQAGQPPVPSYAPPPAPAQQQYVPPPQTPQAQYAPPPQQYVPPAQYTPAPEAYAPVPEKKGGCGKWIFAGCGCLVLLIIVVVVFGFIFDSMQLYCVSPLDSLFRDFIIPMLNNFGFNLALPCP